MSEKLMNRFAREDAARLEAAVQELRASPNLRFFIREVLDSCGLDRLSFNGHALNSAFADGQRSVALGLVQRLSEVDPHFYPELLKEQADERIARNAQLDQSDRAHSH